MADWQAVLERQLADAAAPPVLTRDLLERYSRAANDSLPVPARTLTYWKSSMVDKNLMVPVQRGVFLNHCRARKGALADAGFWYHPDSVVSLNTVLGDSGVLNNPSTVVTIVVPIDQGATPPSRLGRKTTKAGILHFFGMPRRLIEAGTPEDRLDQSGVHEHLRASPEKALLDWIYLGLSPRSRRTLPPRDDIDIELLDARRLERLAAAMGLSEPMTDWL